MNNEEHTGKICPFCQTALKPGDDIHTCSVCNQPHHNDCWLENGGCTTYGCMSGPAMGVPYDSPLYDAHDDSGEWQGGTFVYEDDNATQPASQRSGAAPRIVKGWNWGAFLITPLWTLMMGMELWAVLMVCGIVVIPTWQFKLVFSLTFSLILGAVGSELAWNNRDWRGVDHFIRTQNAWRNWGIHIWIIGGYIAYRIYVEISRF